MALKALLLKKKLDEQQKALGKLRALDAEFERREAELSAAINETTEETSAEDRAAIDAMVDEFTAEKASHDEAKETLERTIGELESQLAAEEAGQITEPPAAKEAERNERKDEKPMNTRMFDKMNVQERDAFFASEDVKSYLEEVRSCIRERRALQNVGLTVPEVMLGLLRQNIEEWSKLYKHVRVRQVGGDGRAVIMGAIPEAIWTDCCGNLNELTLAFNDLEINCWKVGGYFAVCNANLEDSDFDLAAEIMTALGQAIGRALDKAILYGTGSRMPQGIVTRLAQTSEPGSYPATARAWEDLHTTNIKTTAATGKDLFAALMVDFGNASGKYSRSEPVHVMNSKTYAYLMGQAIGFDATGAIVSRVNGKMPVIGGDIEIVEDVADYNVISGYFDEYLLGERAGRKFASSEHVKFLADQTVFKGTARYDGAPAIAEGFVLHTVNNQSAVTSKTFADDEANTVQSIKLNTATASIAGTGTFQLVAFTEPVSGTVTWASGTSAKATVSSTGLVTGVTAGTSTITATCNGLTASCLVTVT